MGASRMNSKGTEILVRYPGQIAVRNPREELLWRQRGIKLLPGDLIEPDCADVGLIY